MTYVSTPIYIPSDDTSTVSDVERNFIITKTTWDEMNRLVLEIARKLRPELEFESSDNEETDKLYASIVVIGYRDRGFLRHKSNCWEIKITFGAFPEFNIFAFTLESLSDIALYVTIREMIKK